MGGNKLRDAARSRRSSAPEQPCDTNQKLELQVLKEEINTTSFHELEVPPDLAKSARDIWRKFATADGANPHMIADMVYGAIVDNMAAMRSAFQSPRILEADKIFSGIEALVNNLHKPARLKALTEVLAFQHMHLDVTIPRVHVVRDAILELMMLELGDDFFDADMDGLVILFNYVGGALIYVKATYTDRVKLLLESWNHANDNQREQNKDEDKPAQALKVDMSGSFSLTSGDEAFINGSEDGCCSCWKRVSRGFGSKGQADPSTPVAQSNASNDEAGTPGVGNTQMQQLPTTFDEMFSINARVMGLDNAVWMEIVVDSFDPIVRNVTNASRLQEEADIAALNIAKYAPDETVNLAEFKSCMLASLRSLLPKIWTTDHEVAWSWMWENVSRMLESELGKTPALGEGLAALQEAFTDQMRFQFFQSTYDRFFDLAPAGQEYFKQSTTRLNFIAERVFQITADIFDDPREMVDEISALGLKHVGFGVPTELFSPFVSAWVMTLQEVVITTLNAHENGLVGFNWSVGLVTKILVRTISEGSTMVMKAINANSPRLLRKALAVAPRRDRALWMLLVEVGSQNISPLDQAIENARMDVATAILQDLLTIRADRDRYYYGVDHLFGRHPDLIMHLSQSAPMLLPALLEGLVWRSHRPKNGLRRVNYYIQHIIINRKGKFSDALKAVVATGDPSLISNDVLVSVSDLLWSRIVHRDFVRSKAWNVGLLVVFVVGVGVLPGFAEEAQGERLAALEVAIFTARMMTYILGISRLIYVHTSAIWHWCKTEMQRIFEEIDEDGNGDIDWEELVLAIGKFRDLVQGNITKALSVFREDPDAVVQDDEDRPGGGKGKGSALMSSSLFVSLVAMAIYEPMLWCVGEPDWPTAYCDNANDIKKTYGMIASCAMIVHWFALIDLSVFSTELSAFLLVVNHVLHEVQQFLTALLFLLLTFGSAITILCRKCTDEGGTFSDMMNAIICLFSMVLRLYQGDFRDMEVNPLLLAAVFIFVTLAAVLALNLLVAQLNLSYAFIYRDMLGFAQLKRASLIVNSMDRCSKKRWLKFMEGARFSQRLEFNEGDLGLAGGIQIIEAASKNRTTVDSILRFGGASDPETPWPESKSSEEEEELRYDRLQGMLQKALKRVADDDEAEIGGPSTAGGVSFFYSHHSYNSAASYSKHSASKTSHVSEEPIEDPVQGQVDEQDGDASEDEEDSSEEEEEESEMSTDFDLPAPPSGSGSAALR